MPIEKPRPLAREKFREMKKTHSAEGREATYKRLYNIGNPKFADVFGKALEENQIPQRSLMILNTANLSSQRKLDLLRKFILDNLYVRANFQIREMSPRDKERTFRFILSIIVRSLRLKGQLNVNPFTGKPLSPIAQQVTPSIATPHNTPTPSTRSEPERIVSPKATELVVNREQFKPIVPVKTQYKPLKELIREREAQLRRIKDEQRILQEEARRRKELARQQAEEQKREHFDRKEPRPPEPPGENPQRVRFATSTGQRDTSDNLFDRVLAHVGSSRLQGIKREHNPYEIEFRLKEIQRRRIGRTLAEKLDLDAVKKAGTADMNLFPQLNLRPAFERFVENLRGGIQRGSLDPKLVSLFLENYRDMANQEYIYGDLTHSVAKVDPQINRKYLLAFRDFAKKHSKETSDGFIHFNDRRQKGEIDTRVSLCLDPTKAPERIFDAIIYALEKNGLKDSIGFKISDNISRKELWNRKHENISNNIYLCVD